MEANAQTPDRRRRARRRRTALGLGLATVLVGAWLVRVPVATGLVDRWAAKRGVPLHYHFDALGPGRQRLTNVVIGDPRAPDLVADWIETGTSLGLGGLSVDSIRIGHLRAHGAWRDGRLSLGSLDRLLPRGSGGAAALPAYDVAIGDAQVQLTSPAGAATIVLAGQGRLDGGFAGRLSASSARLAGGGCVADRVTLDGRLTVAAGAPRWTGPIGAARLRCDGVAAAGPATVRLDAALGPALDRWHGRATLDPLALDADTARLTRLTGTLLFAGDARATTGWFALVGGAAALGDARARALAAHGRFTLGAGPPQLAGTVEAHDARWGRSTAALTDAAQTLDGTPIGPIAKAVAMTLATAARRFDVAIDAALGGGLAHVTRARLAAPGGPAALAEGDMVLAPGGIARGAGRLTLAGPGVPALVARVAWPGPERALTATASTAPFTAGGATLALAPVRLVLAPGGRLAIDSAATLSGPIGDRGRVTALSLPLAIRRDRDELVVDPGCATWRWRELALGTLVLRAAALPVCPIGGALVRVGAKRIGGGAALGRVALTGTLGGGPIALEADGATVALAGLGVAAHGVAVRFGPAVGGTAIGIGSLTGTVTGGTIGGRFAGAGGYVGTVPLVLSEGAGDWRFAGGALTLAGGLTVADAATAAPRFRPLPVRAVRLTLADGRIAATGTLAAPAADRTVATVAIAHDLASGRGRADLAVPGLQFDQQLQPDQLTPLTFGVVADVAGSVTGDGHVAWSRDGVTSTGTFRTGGLDLAAAFGPVTGLAAELHFTDLLALATAPHQRATVKAINPGVPVTDGTIDFQLRPASIVRVEDARWPFAGGTLTLRPTELDLGGTGARRLTFRLDGVDARRFLAQFDFKNLDASGIFDGELPMVFDADGGRIEAGHLGTRAGGGTLAYVGELSAKDLGFWGNLAFQSLKSIRYRDLAITLNGAIAGEMVTTVRFAGISQGAGAQRNFLIRRLQRLPLVFNVRIEAPFRGLLDSAQSFTDPSRLIGRNLPALIREQDRANGLGGAVQPPASGGTP